MQIELPDSVYATAPVLALGLSFGIMYVMVGGWIYFQKRRRKRSPLTKGLLRGPGESLRKKLDNDSTDALALFFAAFVAPVMVFSIHLSQSYMAGTPETWLRIVFNVVLAAGISIYCVVKAIKLFARMRQYQLGLECEVAVGQELNRLEACSFRIFHDFPADKFNIDHIVVGPTGVFAVETKGRSKPMRGKGIEDARVVFNGKSLQFPTWSEKQPIEQARRQAEWLHKWLSQVMGENVAVIPVLALPGWRIDQTNRSEIRVYNGTRPEKLFPEYGKLRFDNVMIRRIAHQLDQRCRDVVPKSDRHTNPEVKRLPA